MSLYSIFTCVQYGGRIRKYKRVREQRGAFENGSEFIPIEITKTVKQFETNITKTPSPSNFLNSKIIIQISDENFIKLHWIGCSTGLYSYSSESSEILFISNFPLYL